MHRESGYNRFFVLFEVFLLGMVTAALSDTVETLFAGWELVGLSSVLLIAFFQERPAPPRNGLRVWVVYRVCDAALMLAAILMHEINGAGDFDHLVGAHAWPKHDPLLVGPHFGLLGVLFIIAAAGKSALVLFSGWLPRAMEGPTPSSAVFYGALSVCISGVFLLLRVSPVLDSSPWLSVLVVALGLVTAGPGVSGGAAKNGHQVGSGFRLVDSGGHHHRGDRLRFPLPGTAAPAGACLPAYAAITSVHPACCTTTISWKMRSVHVLGRRVAFGNNAYRWECSGGCIDFLSSGVIWTQYWKDSSPGPLWPCSTHSTNWNAPWPALLKAAPSHPLYRLRHAKISHELPLVSLAGTHAAVADPWRHDCLFHPDACACGALGVLAFC